MKTLILDTNLLVLLVVGMVNKKYISAHKKLHPVYNEEHYNLLVKLLENYSEIIVTPNTLSETSNLLRMGMKEPAKKEIVTLFKDMIEKTREVYISSGLAAQRSEFIYLGLTDSVLLECGKSNTILLTADRELHAKALSLNYKSFNFWHIVDCNMTSLSYQ